MLKKVRGSNRFNGTAALPDPWISGADPLKLLCASASCRLPAAHDARANKVSWEPDLPGGGGNLDLQVEAGGGGNLDLQVEAVTMGSRKRIGLNRGRWCHGPYRTYFIPD